MSASDELVAFGYAEEEPGVFVKRKAGLPRDKYEKVEGGFLRFTREDGQWVGVPYKIAEAFEGVSGLLFSTHPQCFDTVYPEEYLESIYAVGNQERAVRAADKLAKKLGSAGDA